MRRFVYLLAWGMAIPVLLPAQAQEKSKDSPAAGRYRALLREYQTAQSASSTAYAVAKTDDERPSCPGPQARHDVVRPPVPGARQGGARRPELV